MSITAIILAAGQSRRMGQPKMLLPWGQSTVLQTVISTLQSAGLQDLLVVTGANHKQIEELVAVSARTIYNAGHQVGEMLSSIQAGLTCIQNRSEKAIIVLGDQPQIQVKTLLRLVEAAHELSASLVVPSFDRHRGHPWLVGNEHWDEILAMRSPLTMRDFFRLHQNQIQYVPIEDSSVLLDLDTPDDYLKYRPP